jgi:hypothetical protein
MDTLCVDHMTVYVIDFDIVVLTHISAKKTKGKIPEQTNYDNK